MVCLPTPHDAGWLLFPHLDGLRNVDGVYTIAWRFTDQPDEVWTNRINRFKSGEDTVVPFFRVVNEALPKLIKANGWSPKRTAVSVALSSADIRINRSKPVPRVLTSVSSNSGTAWLPDLLQKNAHRALHGLSSQSEREAELAKAGYEAAPIAEDIRRVLIFDDIATRGDTFSAIAEAIKKTSPHVDVVGLALGKSERVGYAASRGHNISNEQSSRWEKHWKG